MSVPQQTRLSTRKTPPRPKHGRVLKMLDGRLCATSDRRLYLVSGSPDASQLFDQMALKWPLSSLSDPSLLVSAGFRRRDIREVTQDEFRRIGNVLRKLRKRSSVADRFEHRFREIEDMFRKLQAAEPAGRSPLLLSEDDERQLSRQCEETLTGRFLPDLQEIARAVYWLSGGVSLHRFLSCLASHVPQRSVWANRHDWKRLLGELRAIRRQFPTNSKRNRSGVRAALVSALSRIPAEFRTRHNITAPAHDEFALKTLDGLLKRAQAECEKWVDPPSRRMLAALGALCAVDGAQAIPPAEIFNADRDQNGVVQRQGRGNFEALIEALIRERGQKGYEKLFSLFGATQRLLAGSDIATCRNVLAAGGTAADIDWLMESDVFWQWQDKQIAPSPIRRLAETLRQWDVYFGYDELGTLCHSIRTKRDLIPFVVARRWLELFPKDTLQEGIVLKLKSACVTSALATSLHDRVRSFLPMWVVPPKSVRAPEIANADDELNRWLKHLAWYQRLAGNEPRFPKAVRKAAAAASGQTSELKWMRHRRNTGSWNDHLEQRYRNLQARENVATHLISRKLIETTARAASVAGVDILEQKLCEFSTLWWRARFGQLGAGLNRNERAEICGWLGRLDENNAALLDQIVSAWESAGPEFKRNLPFNRKWIEQAESNCFDVAGWLKPRRWKTQLDVGGPIEIAIEHDPFDVFLMGSRFHTCLGLRSGCNHLSVLPNAADANKAVIYVDNGNGTIFARKLLTISTDGGLLGYHTYCHRDHGKGRRQLLDAVERFCGSLAGELGIPLADEGEPDEIGEHFWYDDDPVIAAWPGGSPDIEESVKGVPRWKERLTTMGIAIEPTIDAVLKKVDAVMIMTVDGRAHLDVAEQALRAGKPVYIGRPMAASLEDVIRIFALSKKYRTPLFSCSQHRFSPGFIGMRNHEEVGDVLGCNVYGGCPTEKHHAEFFWHAIHGFETLYTIMRPGAVSVTRTSTPDAELVTGVWKDGRIGTYRGIRKGAIRYSALVFGSKGVAPAGKYGYAAPVKGVVPKGRYKGYEGVATEIAKFFKTRKLPVSPEETIELFAFMEAAHESKRRGGVPVRIDEVLKKARKTVAGQK
eukprot:g8274.t1